MKQIISLLLMLLILSPSQASTINVKRAGTMHQGGARIPSATQVVADYDNGVITIDVSRYTGTIQLYVYDANNTVVDCAVATISGSGTVTMNICDMPQGTYRLCIVLDNATYSGDFSI
ncbi:hypothetical protein PRLR6025_03380 [Prevotella lacticifex]|uniref:DUF3244 domain-containing protein n=1 Tax=Prevotella lacticifex TaxID=2854755 RepID=UPI0020862D8D|nr:hypothetical protein PRLR6025_03380 [Prevotella lacticifex]